MQTSQYKFRVHVAKSWVIFLFPFISFPVIAYIEIRYRDYILQKQGNVKTCAKHIMKNLLTHARTRFYVGEEKCLDVKTQNYGEFFACANNEIKRAKETI